MEDDRYKTHQTYHKTKNLDSKVYPHQSLSSGESIPWGIDKVRALDVSDVNVYNQKVCM